MSTMPTIKHISKRSGFTASTVADVLRDRPGYKQETKEKILRIARELHYRPNRLSIALNGGRTMTIGLLGGHLDMPSSYSKVKSVEAVARERGYHVYYVNTPWQYEGQGEEGEHHVRDLLARRVDGILVGYAGDWGPPPLVIKALRSARIPLVSLDCNVPGIAHRVAVNRAVGIRQAVVHLAGLGHKHVAMITNQLALNHPGAKVQSYLDGCQQAGIRISTGAPWVINVTGDIERETSELVKARFVGGGDLPTALLLFEDTYAIAVIRGLRDIGLQVPRDVSVVGFNDVSVAPFVTPSLTTIRQPREEVGRTACQMLLNLLDDIRTDPVVEFPCSLVVRESTGPRAVRQP